MQVNDRLYRSVDDRVIAGVAGGLADRLGLDPSLVRIIWTLLIIFSGGAFLLVYIVMAIVVPEEDELWPPVTPPGPTSAGMTGAAGMTGTAGTEGSGQAGPGGDAGGGSINPPAAGWPQPPMGSADWRLQSRAARRAARAARRANRGPGQGVLIFGVILILIGLWLLAREYIPWLDFDRIWPLVLVGLGVVLLAFSFAGRPGGGGQPKS